MNAKRLFAILGMAVSLSPTIGGAHAQVSVSEAPSQHCELHFWPSPKSITSDYSGVGGVLGGALSGSRPVTSDRLVADLPPTTQADELRKLDLAALLNMPGVEVIEEKMLADLKAASRKGARLSSSPVPCYAELVIYEMGYMTHITAGRWVFARFYLRRFANGADVGTVQSGYSNTHVKLYPPKQAEDAPAALEELRAAFGSLTQHFLEKKKR